MFSLVNSESDSLSYFIYIKLDNEMEGQDILDINDKMLGKLIPPVGKQLLFLREQAALKDATSLSVRDNPHEGVRKSQPTDHTVETRTNTPVSSICGEQSSSPQSETLLSDDEEVSRQHPTVISDEKPGDLWSDLQNYK